MRTPSHGSGGTVGPWATRTPSQGSGGTVGPWATRTPSQGSGGTVGPWASSTVWGAIRMCPPTVVPAPCNTFHVNANVDAERTAIIANLPLNLRIGLDSSICQRTYTLRRKLFNLRLQHIV